MESQILEALGRILNKNNFEVYLKLNFNNFQEKKLKSLRLIATKFSPLELTLLDFVST